MFKLEFFKYKREINMKAILPPYPNLFFGVDIREKSIWVIEADS